MNVLLLYKVFGPYGYAHAYIHGDDVRRRSTRLRGACKHFAMMN